MFIVFAFRKSNTSTWPGVLQFAGTCEKGQAIKPQRLALGVSLPPKSHARGLHLADGLREEGNQPRVTQLGSGRAGTGLPGASLTLLRPHI